MSGRYGGPPDGGLTTAMVRFSDLADGAREEFVHAAREADVSPVLKVLCDALAGVDAMPPPVAPVASVEPVQADQEPRQLGWSAKRRRQA